MRKEIYLIQGSKEESYADFTERIIVLSKEVAGGQGVNAVKVTYTHAAPPMISVIPFKKHKIAAISVLNNDLTALTLLTDEAGCIGAYRVDEAIPVGYQKSWEDLQLTPGICLFTLFKKKVGLSQELFLDRWHNSHTPLSLKIHPLWNYNRNVVKERLTEDSVEWDGIVEEQFKTTSDLLNPIKFFGNPLIMPYRMWQVYADTKSFLDYGTIEPYYAMEMHIKSH